MGNTQEIQVNERELEPYMKSGLEMKDLINLKKAFLSLDTNNSGRILYDVRKIADIDKYDLPVEDQDGKVVIDFNQFMDIMTTNIIRNREKFGTEATTYESSMSTVTCLLCPIKK